MVSKYIRTKARVISIEYTNIERGDKFISVYSIWASPLNTSDKYSKNATQITIVKMMRIEFFKHFSKDLAWLLIPLLSLVKFF